MLILKKRHSALSGNLCSASKREVMQSFTYGIILLPFEQRFNLYGLEKPSNKNLTVGKDSSSFFSGTNKASTLMMISDARN